MRYRGGGLQYWASMLVKRSCIIVSTAVAALALAVPGVARAGWSWGDDAAPTTDSSTAPAPDGWSWGGESTQARQDGWTWGE
jgi:hypothetical protein